MVLDTQRVACTASDDVLVMTMKTAERDLWIQEKIR